MLRNLARSVTPRAAGVVFLLVALCAVAASTSLAASPPSPPVRHTGGFVPPIHGGVKPQDNCPPCDPAGSLTTLSPILLKASMTDAGLNVPVNPM